MIKAILYTLKYMYMYINPTKLYLLNSNNNFEFNKQ